MRGQSVKITRERMVDLVGALNDGEDLSELLAPRTYKSAQDRWKLLEEDSTRSEFERAIQSYILHKRIA